MSPHPGGLFWVTQGLVADIPHREIPALVLLGSLCSQHWGLQWLILLCILFASGTAGKRNSVGSRGVLQAANGVPQVAGGVSPRQTCWSVVMHTPSWDTQIYA